MKRGSIVPLDSDYESILCDLVYSVRLDEREKAAQRVADAPVYAHVADTLAYVLQRNVAIAAARGEDME